MARRPRRQNRHQKRQPSENPKGVRETVLIAELGRRGDGVAELANNERCFVPFTLSGETVEVERFGNRAQLINVTSASPDRIDPPCPHFCTCGGCALQHFATAPYQAWKRDLIKTALSHKGLETEIDPLVDAHGEGRRRVTFHAKREGGALQVGLMAARSHQVLNIDNCPILEPKLQPSLTVARAIAEIVPTRSKPLDLQFTTTLNGIDCDIRGGAGDGADFFSEITELSNKFDLARVTFDGETVIERRPPQISVGGIKLVLPPAGFLQATQAGEEILANLVLEHLDGLNRVADLFCGLGTFALRIAETTSVYAADNNAPGLAALTQAANHAQNQKPIEVEQRDLFERPMMPAELNKLEAVVFDPPRAGAKAQAEQIAESTIGTVVAVSCDPVSFARDAAVLVAGGFSLKCITPVDQFKYSSHVELVARLERT